MAELRSLTGWPSYTGSGHPRPGSYHVGAAASNDIVLPAGPATLGQLALDAQGRGYSRWRLAQRCGCAARR